MSILEGFLKRVQFFYCPQPFNGQNLVTVSLYGKHETRADSLAIKHNRARAAHAMFTTDMGASQTELVPQEIAQQHAWLDSAYMASAVDGYRDCH